MTPLTLQIQDRRPIEVLSWEQIEQAFAKWDTLRRGFFILGDARGSYVQTAGAIYKATVEFRQVHEDGSLSHYVLGHPTDSIEPTSIFTCVGIIKLNESEIFKLAEVLEIFRSFYDQQSVPQRFVRRDDTKRFGS
jgi:hypothetical protein